MTKENRSPSNAAGIEPLPSGVEGLDEILEGGLPRDCFFLLQGDPGSGKTTLALQFLLDGIRLGEKGFYITLSETKEELWRVARSHGWSLDGVALLELSAIEELLRPEEQTTVFRSSEMELNKITQLLLNEAEKAQPSRVIFDSLSEFRLVAETPLRYRRHLLRLKQEFARFSSTVLLLDDKMDKAGVRLDPHVMSLSHGAIEMEQLSPEYGASRRRLRVLKLRGTSFRAGWHDYGIFTGGLRVFPRLIASEHRAEVKRQSVPSGIPELDSLLGGGLVRGTTTLLLGAAGTGKSTLAVQFAVRLAKQGEQSLLFTFDETLGIMLERTKALGLDLEPHIKAGLINAQQVDPAELSPGEFAVRVRRGVEAGAKLVMIDSLNGYLTAMPGERYLNSQLHELSNYLNQQGVITILIMAQHGLVAAVEAPLDLSYLADMVVNMRYFESVGEVKQAISVIKKRSGPHEKTIREYKLETGKGIHIGQPLTDFQGILSGAPVFVGGGGQMIR